MPPFPYWLRCLIHIVSLEINIFLDALSPCLCVSGYMLDEASPGYLFVVGRTPATSQQSCNRVAYLAAPLPDCTPYGISHVVLVTINHVVFFILLLSQGSWGLGDMGNWGLDTNLDTSVNAALLLTPYDTLIMDGSSNSCTPTNNRCIPGTHWQRMWWYSLGTSLCVVYSFHVTVDLLVIFYLPWPTTYELLPKILYFHSTIILWLDDLVIWWSVIQSTVSVWC